MTVRDLIIDALSEIGVATEGEPLTAYLAENCLRRLNRMIQSWNTESLSIYTTRISVYNLVANKQTYTIGPGGDFDAPRPITIENANIILNTVSPVTRQPLPVVNDDTWASIRVQNVPNTIPQCLYNDGAYPLSTLYLWGYPSSNLQLELYTWQALTEFATLDDAVVFPPGYEDALMYNLAVRMGPSLGIAVQATTAELAASSKAAIQKLNLPSPLMVADPAVSGSARPSDWNYITGLFNGGQS